MFRQNMLQYLTQDNRKGGAEERAEKKEKNSQHDEEKKKDPAEYPAGSFYTCNRVDNYMCDKNKKSYIFFK